MNQVFLSIKWLSFWAILIIFHVQSFSQSTAGITTVPDTTYSNYTAYQKDKKYHPQISLAAKKKNAAVKEMYDITYCNINGRKLKLDVFYPAKKSNKSRIAVIMIHGGGWRSGNRTQHHALAQNLAMLGYVSFTPEYRLSTEALYPAAIYDVKSAVRWVRANAKKYGINQDAVVIAGFSAGGELAAFIGNTNNNKKFDGNDCNGKLSSSVNAVVDIDGTLSFVHPESGEGDDSKQLSAGTLWFGYSKRENIQLWTDASPLTYAGKNSVPTLFLNSSVDRMHAGRDDYMKILGQNSIYTEVHTFDDAPHSFILYNPWFEPSISYIDKFLRKVFKY